jgi:hypothetical protein
MNQATKNIVKKLEAKKKLSLAEEHIYLAKIVGLPSKKVELIVTIANNKNQSPDRLTGKAKGNSKKPYKKKI